MNYTKCVGKPLALEYNEKYVHHIKLSKLIMVIQKYFMKIKHK